MIPDLVLIPPPPGNFYVVLVAKRTYVLGFPDSVCDLSGGEWLPQTASGHLVSKSGGHILHTIL